MDARHPSSEGRFFTDAICQAVNSAEAKPFSVFALLLFKGEPAHAFRPTF
jgi:hypothetical protein